MRLLTAGLQVQVLPGEPFPIRGPFGKQVERPSVFRSESYAVGREFRPGVLQQRFLIVRRHPHPQAAHASDEFEQGRASIEGFPVGVPQLGHLSRDGPEPASYLNLIRSHMSCSTVQDSRLDVFRSFRLADGLAIGLNAG